MKKTIALLTTLFLFSNHGLAQTIKVLKIQGKKAIVEVNDPSSIRINQIYSLDEGTVSNSSSVTNGHINTGKRTYGVGLDFNFSNLKSDAAGASASNSLSIAGSFVWNLKRFEIGPSLGYSNYKQGNSDSTSTSFGAVAFYNFNENKPGVDQIFSVIGSFAIGSTSASSGSSTSTTTIQVGPSYRWFLLSQDHCLAISGVYSMAKSSANGTDATITGFKIIGGIATYF